METDSKHIADEKMLDQAYNPVETTGSTGVYVTLLTIVSSLGYYNLIEKYKDLIKLPSKYKSARYFPIGQPLVGRVREKFPLHQVAIFPMTLSLRIPLFSTMMVFL